MSATIMDLINSTNGKLKSYVMVLDNYYPELDLVKDLEGASLGQLLRHPGFGRKTMDDFINHVAEEFGVNVGGHTLTKKLVLPSYKSNKHLKAQNKELEYKLSMALAREAQLKLRIFDKQERKKSFRERIFTFGD